MAVSQKDRRPIFGLCHALSRCATRPPFWSTIRNIKSIESGQSNLGLRSPQEAIYPIPPFYEINVKGVYAVGDRGMQMKSVTIAVASRTSCAGGLAMVLLVEMEGDSGRFSERIVLKEERFNLRTLKRY